MPYGKVQRAQRTAHVWPATAAATAFGLVAAMVPAGAAGAAVNQRPDRPTELAVDGRPCSPQTARTWVTSTTPVLTAWGSGPDAGQQSLSTVFSVRRAGQPPSTADTVHGTSANPATVHAAVPAAMALEHATSYVVRARTTDGTADGPWSVPCRFQVDVVAPDPPADVSSIDYPEYDPADPNNAGRGGAGIPGVFTITPPALGAQHIVGYAYTLDSGIGPGSAPIAPAASGGAATLELQPTRDGHHTLRVWARDAAGLFSTAIEYEFVVAAGSEAPVALAGPAGRCRWTASPVTRPLPQLSAGRIRTPQTRSPCVRI
ncbi:hypothetical protein ACN27F_05450 [Solwaraspora sp. WMMB335]|uniref:hypothetical protein n=1 Tax=Solwaraspora sp. WMMB335 TaxID=3404118 RepID=UPI003B9241D5